MMIETVSMDRPGQERRVVKKELGKDDFLLLLTQQLKSQDPMQPMENLEFIAQTAQFSALEQTANLNENFKAFMNSQQDLYRLQVLGLVGMEVTAEQPGETPSSPPTQVKGIVSGVTLKNGKAMLAIGDKQVLVDEITNIRQPAAH